MSNYNTPDKVLPFGTYKAQTPYTPKEVEDAQERITTCRIFLLKEKNFAFFGMIALRLIPIPAPFISTIGTDGKYMYFNPKFINELPIKQLVFAIAHEVLHIVYDHIGRSKDARLDSELSCAAQDYVINLECKDVNIGELPKWVLLDEKFRNMSSEEVYYLLRQQAEKLSGAGRQKMMEGLEKGQFDSHIVPEDSENGTGESDGSAPAKFTAEQRSQLAADIMNDVVNAAKSAGNLPLGVQRFVESLLTPKLDWKTIITENCLSLIPSDIDYTKLSRNGWDLDCILPGTSTEPSVEVDAYLDMSGSIGREEATEFLTEVYGIMDTYNSYQLRLGCWDTELYNVVDFTETNDINDLLAYDIKGGGGTDPMCIFNNLREEGRKPKKVLIFTDGMFGLPPNFDGYGQDVIWLINNKNKQYSGHIPFGIVCYYS